MSRPLLTIVVGTRNRPALLSRMLAYLATVGCEHEVCIADSSDHHELSLNAAAIQERSQALRLRHLTLAPDIGFHEKIWRGLSTVATPYAGLGSDDDFIIPASAQRCAEFLDTNPSYAIAHGAAASFTLAGGAAVHGTIESFAQYPQCHLEADRACERIQRHAQVYRTTFYSIHRIQHLQHNWHAAIGSDFEFGELLTTFLSLAQGKSKRLDLLFMVRQVHQQSTTASLSDVFDWIATSRWAEQFHKLRTHVGVEVARQDRLSIEAAESAVKRAFWTYLSERCCVSLGTQMLDHTKDTNEGTFVAPLPDPRLDLGLLMRGQSPFTADFRPIVEVLRHAP